MTLCKWTGTKYNKDGSLKNGPCDHYDCPQMRIVLVGKTGVGKSAVGNTILGKKQFESVLSSASVTVQCKKEHGMVDDKHVAVVDTPGLFDTEKPDEKIHKDLVKCIQISSPGPHVFLLVMQLNRFTEEEKRSVEALQEIFGEEANKYMIILFTRGDDLQDQTIHEFVQNAHPDLKELIRKCGNRYHVFDNRALFNRTQVKELISTIERMMAMNGGSFYTQEMYQEAEAKIREKEAEIKKAIEERKKQTQERMEKERLERVMKLKEQLQVGVEAEVEKHVMAMRQQFDLELKQARRKAEEAELKLSFTQRLKQKLQSAFMIAKKK